MPRLAAPERVEPRFRAVVSDVGHDVIHGVARILHARHVHIEQQENVVVVERVVATVVPGTVKSIRASLLSPVPWVAHVPTTVRG